MEEDYSLWWALVALPKFVYSSFVMIFFMRWLNVPAVFALEKLEEAYPVKGRLMGEFHYF